jgi:hypothetical protein
VGFTLPWAGVTPAPSVKKEKMRDFVPVRRVSGRWVGFFLSSCFCVILERSEFCLLSLRGRG